MSKLQYILFYLSIPLLLTNCQEKEEVSSLSESPQFELLTKETTNLSFENKLTQTVEFNVFAYMYFFNGGGVAAGDFNNDGKEDLFFTANMMDNKLFLNEGNFKFKDVTGTAGMKGKSGWTTGTSLVDINNDGMLDIYVSQMHGVEAIEGVNQFYICQKIENGIPIYEDKASEFGLDFSGFATQAAFFDYDLDGDLDMFQLNHSLHNNGTFGKKKSFDNTEHPEAGDKLMRNDSENGRIIFTDITKKAGLYNSVIGYGLGIVTGDVNLDGYPDIYIGNDFHENDYLYINQGDGTFKDMMTEKMTHTSRFSMGVDMADINNDGYPEIISLDMLPYDPQILKASLGEDTHSIFKFKLGYGYHPQFARNNLQLNNRNGAFTEIGIFSGIYATDWSWAPLWMDFDYDGQKDLFVANGIPRRMNDIDYSNFRLSDEDIRFKTTVNHLEDDELSYIEKMPQIKIPNKFYSNNGDLTFSNIENQIQNDLPSYSNGAVYVDLDNDGDLDVVTNNIDDAPFIYKNLTNDKAELTTNYLHFTFQGSPQNINAIGAKVIVNRKEEQLVFEHFPVRGYQSSVALGLHIGLGTSTNYDKVTVIWPDQTFETTTKVAVNGTTKLEWKPGLPKFDFTSLHKAPESPFQLEETDDNLGIDFFHDENPFVEFNREALIPHMVSSEGPALAIGDINGDGKEDVFIGGAKRRRSALYLQNENGFSNQTPMAIAQDSISEHTDAVFIDVESDGDLDLVVASGGNEFRGEHPARKQRTYLNDGKGNLSPIYLFPEAHLAASCIVPGDFNGDGLVDFFIGARAKTDSYGKTPISFLYENKGNTKFELVTDKYAKGLSDVGLVKDGNWTDIDNDGDLDLVLALEWQAITVFLNHNGTFKKRPINDLKGWWNFVLSHDFDGDGDMDILAGNLGKNTKMQPTKEQPIRAYLEDYDENGTLDQILTYYLEDREIPFHNHAELTKQLTILKKKFLYAKDLSQASLEEIFGKAKLTSAEILEADFMKSAYFENMGDMTFTTHPLPDRLQFSTMNAVELTDLNNDGTMEVLIGGNFYDSNIEMGRYDADFGNVLTIGQDGKMEVYPFFDTPIHGQTRNISSLNFQGEQYYIFARNEGTVKVLKQP